MIKSRAAVLRKIGNKRPYGKTKPLQIEEIEVDAPQRNEVLVKIKATGLCHSDLSVINGSRSWPIPLVLGHEAAGEVVEVGEGVTRFEKGDHVVFSFKASCGHCPQCQAGKPALCIPGSKANNSGTLLGGGIRFHQGKNKIYHHLGVSAFSEYTVCSEFSLVKIKPEYPFEVASLFGCAVMTGVGSVINTGKIKAGENVLVVGLGGVGLSAIMGAKAAGAAKVLAADIDDNKLSLARKLGADETVNTSKEGALQYIKDYTNGGPDLSVEFAGVMSALEFSFNATNSGGRTVTGALPSPGSKMSLDPLALVGMEKSLYGCYLGSCIPNRDIPNYLELYKKGLLPVNHLITDTLRLDDINEGFESLASGKAVRQIILFD